MRLRLRHLTVFLLSLLCAGYAVAKPLPGAKATGVASKSPGTVSPVVVAAVPIACTIASAALLAILLVRGKRGLDRTLQDLAATVNSDASRSEEALQACSAKLTGLDAGHEALAKQLDTLSERFAAEAKTVAAERLDAVAAELRELRADLQRLDNLPGAASRGVVSLEREVLNESWKAFCANKDLSDSFDSATNDQHWREISQPLLGVLPKLVPDELKPAFEAALTPAREYNNLVGKIAVVPRIVSGEAGPLKNEAQELRRTRELVQLLSQSSSAISDRLNFRLKSWIIDHFLSFADLYLQRYQQARIEKRREPALEEGVPIVRQILRVAGVEPIDLELGETAFDSTRHIGRSTMTDARYSDGVIVGVIRNGFVEAGAQVIRQPEVVVNRTR